MSVIASTRLEVLSSQLVSLGAWYSCGQANARQVKRWVRGTHLPLVRDMMYRTLEWVLFNGTIIKTVRSVQGVMSSNKRHCHRMKRFHKTAGPQGPYRFSQHSLNGKEAQWEERLRATRATCHRIRQ